MQQIAITSSTSAGLDQILPWLYYHRVIGVTNYILFVEGQAASVKSTAVLEAIPVCDFYLSLFFSRSSACLLMSMFYMLSVLEMYDKNLDTVSSVIQ